MHAHIHTHAGHIPSVLLGLCVCFCLLVYLVDCCDLTWMSLPGAEELCLLWAVIRVPSRQRYPSKNGNHAANHCSIAPRVGSSLVAEIHKIVGDPFDILRVFFLWSWRLRRNISDLSEDHSGFPGHSAGIIHNLRKLYEYVERAAVVSTIIIIYRCILQA